MVSYKRNLVDAKNPRWHKPPEKCCIKLDCKFKELPDKYFSFIASKHDKELHGRVIFDRAINLEFGEIGPYEKPEDKMSPELKEKIEVMKKERPLTIKKRNIREQRNQILTLTDWTQVPDSPITDDIKQQWKTYRQLLREVPQQKNFPDYVDWPDAPHDPA